MKKVSLLLSLLLIAYSQITAQLIWEPVNGPYTGSIKAITRQSGSGHLFAATWGYDILCSTDNGTTWFTQYIGQTYFSSFAECRGFLFAGDDWGIYRNNLGIWQSLTTPFRYVTDLLCKDTTLYVATTDAKIFLSRDKGINWTQVSILPYPITSLTESGGFFYAGTNGYGVYKSTDQGVNWFTANSGLSNLAVRDLISCDSTIMAATMEGVYRLLTNDSVWSGFSEGLPTAPVTHLMVSDTSVYAAVHRSIGNGGGVYRSNVTANEWVPCNGDLNSGVMAQTVFVDDSVMLLGTDRNEIFRSTNGGINWSSAYSGQVSFDVMGLAVTGDTILAGDDGPGVFKSIDKGKSWIEENFGLTYKRLRSLAIRDSYVFAGEKHGGIYRSTDFGKNWINCNWGYKVYDFAFDGNDVYAGDQIGIHVTTDNGVSWRLMNQSPWTLFLLSHDGYILGGYEGLYRKEPEDTNWNLVHSSTYSLANSNNLIYSGSDSGRIYCSTDYGENWITVGAIGANLTITSLAATGPIVIAKASGTSGGIFLSTDYGKTWASFNNGLTNLDIYELVIEDNVVYAGTFGSGIFKCDLSPLLSAETSTTIPHDPVLWNNYPNPFNPSTTIRYQLAENSKVTLKIYNLLGQEVRTLVNTQQSNGIHSVVWDGKNEHGQMVGSGVYFYRLQAGDVVKTRKMVLVK